MDAPKCRICGKREFNHICAGDATAPDRPARNKAARPKSAKPVFDRSVVRPVKSDEEILARLESVEERLSVLEKRKTYNRDYMRRKRAEERSV